MNLSDRYLKLGDAMDGGMSSVFPYHDEVLDRNVALKIIPPGPNRRRINDELLALFKIRSKHVVQVYDVVRDPVNIGIIQEFIEGDDLLCSELEPDNKEQFLKVIWQIASGINEVHAAGVIHRDIKPNNMKIDHEGILKIFDFGLARDTGPDAATLGFVGTRGFAAPELYAAAVSFTPAVDTYAFGATALYYGLRDLPDEMIAQPPAPLSSNPFLSLPFTLPAEVSDMLFRCLEQEPLRRPSMADVCEVIEKHLLFDLHRALIVNGANASYLDRNSRNVRLSLGEIGAIGINYNGFSFSVTLVEGNVYINNAPASIGNSLPGACVLTFGGPELGNRRVYVTFDLSNPGIVL